MMVSLKCCYQDKLKTFEKFKEFLYEEYELIYLLLAEIISFGSFFYQSLKKNGSCNNVTEVKYDLNYLQAFLKIIQLNKG